MKKKIAIIGTVGLPANYGGFETLANHIVKNLGDKYQFTVYCTKKRYPKNQRQKTYAGANLKYMKFDANGIQSIPYDIFSIFHALFYADVLLVLGVPGAIMFPFIRLFTRKKIIVSIDGIEWKRDKWNTIAKLYLWIAERIAVKYSHIDISDNESIQDYTAMRYGSLSRIIEYGGDHVSRVESEINDYEKFPFLKFQYAVKVCRIEPENNVHVVLEAYSKMPDKYLVIVGNWNNSEYGKILKEQFGNYKNIFLINPIYDQRIIDLLRSNAILYIHGHSAGGTNPSLVEAMCHSLPILSFNVSYNRTTTENKAHYFSTSEDIQNYVYSLSIEGMRVQSSKMKEIANRRYKWKIIAFKYDLLFKEALFGVIKNRVKPTLSGALNNEKLIEHQAGHLKHQYSFFEKR